MAAHSGDSTQTGLAALDGAALKRAFEGAAAALEVQRDTLNALNVFPVPDGDTGTNMSLTMRAAVRAAEGVEGSASAVAKAVADGALMGAHGNSGVILSQILAGIAGRAHSDYDGKGISRALVRAKDAAYRVVSQPREGTILTAITAAADTSRLSAADGGGAADVLSVAAAAAQVATDRTPELLPVLKEAGVVDAGALGLAIVLDAMVRALRGDAPAAATDVGEIYGAWLSATRRVHEGGEAAGFCTEFVVTGTGLDLDAMRSALSRFGESLLVVGDRSMARVHLHTPTPDAALAYGREQGAVSREKVEDMEAQFRQLANEHEPAASDAAVAVVAVAAGHGLEALFRSLGAREVVHGGQMMNPSPGEIREAITAAAAWKTIVLPNNKNIVMAAQQAAASIGGGVRVIASTSIPQGVAAMVALNPELSLDDNVAAMEQAIASVRSGEVTLAARATKLHGIDVREGQPIALVDDDLAAAEATVEDAVRACVSLILEGREGAIVTLYTGADETAEAAEAIADSLRARFRCEVEVVPGGQPHYPYLIGVE
jgi:hypothetical protein